MSVRGRPRAFDRDAALLTATRLFWARGYDGTSVSDLTTAMRISPSSFYAAFGDKKSLFNEAVRGYMQRYTAIYIEASRAANSRDVAEQILRASADEFTAEDRPMTCLVVSAAIHGGAETIDVRRTLEEHQRALGKILAERIDQDKAAGSLPADVDTALLTDWVQTLWQGLSNQSNAGIPRGRLHEIVTLAMHSWPNRPASPDRTQIASPDHHDR